MVDISHKLPQNPVVTAEGLLTDGVDADYFQDIDLEEAHLFDISSLS